MKIRSGIWLRSGSTIVFFSILSPNSNKLLTTLLPGDFPLMYSKPCRLLYTEIRTQTARPAIRRAYCPPFVNKQLCCPRRTSIVQKVFFFFCIIKVFIHFLDPRGWPILRLTAELSRWVRVQGVNIICKKRFPVGKVWINN